MERYYASKISMIHTIRVFTKNRDSKGEALLHDIRQILHVNSLQKIETVKVYRIEGTGEKEAKILAEKLFCEEISHSYTLNKRIENNKKNLVLEIAYKPGGMNHEIGSIFKVANDLGIKAVAVDSSIEYIFFGNINKDIVKDLVSKIR